MDKTQELREAVRIGDAELDAGLGIAYSPEALQAITEAAIKALHSGLPIDPAVLP